MNDPISIIAGIFGLIGVSLISIYTWFSKHIIVVKRHKVGDNIGKDSLSYPDIENGLRHLSTDAQRYNPDCILGINRGGAIVGGVIAKRLGMQIHLLQVNCDWAEGSRVREERSGNAGNLDRILLVDDAKRKGEHMREAVEYLKQKYPGATIRRAVMLELSGQHVGLEKTTFREYAADISAFNTDSVHATLPWDVRT